MARTPHLALLAAAAALAAAAVPVALGGADLERSHERIAALKRRMGLAPGPGEPADG